MNVRGLVNHYKKMQENVANNNPFFKAKGQTEFTLENYEKLKKELKDFGDRKLKFVEFKEDSE